MFKHAIMSVVIRLYNTHTCGGVQVTVNEKCMQLHAMRKIGRAACSK